MALEAYCAFQKQLVRDFDALALSSVRKIVSND
jgi:hypothetical protein